MPLSFLRLATWGAAAGCLFLLWKINEGATSHILSVFLSIVLDAFPFLLLGALASAALETLVPERYIQAIAPKNRVLGVLFGSLLGFVLPLCECGMIPIARRLIRKGLPAYIGIVYIMAGPVVNPVVFASTVFAFHGKWDMAWARLALALGVSLIVGMALILFMRTNPLRGSEVHSGNLGQVYPIQENHDHEHHHNHNHNHNHNHSHDHHHGHSHSHHHDHSHDHQHNHDHHHSHDQHHGHSHDHQHSHSGKFYVVRDIVSHASIDIRDMGRYLLLGAGLTAIIQASLAPAALESAADHSWLSHVFLMGFAYLLSLCSTSDAFVASSLSGLFHPGALLAFLVFGPMFSLKSTIMMLAVFRRRFVWKFAALTAAMVLIGSLLFEQQGWVN